MYKITPLYLADRLGGPPTGTLLTQLADLPRHGGKDLLFEEEGHRLNIFIQQHGDTVHVYENRCPHAGTPLNMVGEKFLSLDGRSLLCRTHGALFAIDTGKCTRGPCKGQYLRPVAFEIKDGGVYSC